MAECAYCKGEMREVHGCNATPLVIEGTEYLPIPWGRERVRGVGRANGRCHDCGVDIGAVHHHGCDVERCPACGDQSISCGCVWAGEEHLSEDWLEEMEDRLLGS